MTWEVVHEEAEQHHFYRTLAWEGGWPRWCISVSRHTEDVEMPERVTFGFGYAAQESDHFEGEEDLDPALLGHVAELALKAHLKFGPWFPVDGFREAFGEGAVQGIPPREEAAGALMEALAAQPSRVGVLDPHAQERVQEAAASAVLSLPPGSEAQHAAYQMALRFFPEQETEDE